MFDRNTYWKIIDNAVFALMYHVHYGPASFLLKEDNCGPHRAKHIGDYQKSEEAVRMEWSAHSQY